MTVPAGNSEFCFPSTLSVPLGFASGNIKGPGETKLTISLGASHSVLGNQPVVENDIIYTISHAFVKAQNVNKNFPITILKICFFLCFVSAKFLEKQHYITVIKKSQKSNVFSVIQSSWCPAAQKALFGLSTRPPKHFL